VPAIHLATAAGLRTLGREGDDPLGGFDTTTLIAGGGALFAPTRNRRIWRIADDRAESVVRASTAGSPGACSGTRERSGSAPTRPVWCASAPAGSRAPKRPATTWTLATDGAALYVNVHVGGILRSDDGGASFVPTIEIDDDVHEVSAAADGAVLAATGERGLAVSRDRGATWAHHADGLHASWLATERRPQAYTGAKLVRVVEAR
jgi:hypothetical protein